MDTAGPAARAAYAFFKFGTYPPDVIVAGLFPFDRGGPADPFVAGERGDVVPFCERGLVGSEGLP